MGKGKHIGLGVAALAAGAGVAALAAADWPLWQQPASW